MKFEDLSKYDQFYRFVADPFHHMQLKVFMHDLDELIFRLESEFENKHKHVRFNLERIPYTSFIKWYQNNKSYPGWTALIEDVDSPFMKLMQIDNLFFQIDKVDEKKASDK